MLKKTYAFGFIAAMTCASFANADTMVNFVDVDNTSALDGLITTDILVDFTGQWGGSQLLLELEEGGIYRDPAGNADGSPQTNDLIIGLFPSVVFDTTVYGGAPGGSAANIGSTESEATFPDNGGTLIDQAWNPAGGEDISNQTGFLTARITLTPDAVGSFTYFHSTDDDELFTVTGDIVNGVLVPEPASLAVVATAGIALATRRRRIA